LLLEAMQRFKLLMVQKLSFQHLFSLSKSDYNQ
jgi:hypothetical protein